MELIAAGRDADVYRWSDTLVLRRYRDGRSAVGEAATLREVGALGYPVPAVESVDGPDVVMELVDGPTLADMLLEGRMTPSAGGELIAGLLDRLHGLSRPDGRALLHLDLHPFNVMMSGRGPMVIDWTNARPGSPGLDIAMSMLIVAQLAVAPDSTVIALGREPLTEYLRALAAATATTWTPHLAEAESRRRADRYQSADERASLGDAVALARSLATPGH